VFWTPLRTTGEHTLVYVTFSGTGGWAKLLGSVRSPFVAYGFGREGQIGNVLTEGRAWINF